MGWHRKYSSEATGNDVRVPSRHTFCRMLPYADTPIKHRLEAEGRLLGTPFGASHARSFTFSMTAGVCRIVDTRPCAYQTRWTTEGLETEIYRLCDCAQTPASLVKEISTRRGTTVRMQEIEAGIDTLCRSRIVLRLNNKVLGIAAGTKDLSSLPAYSSRPENVQESFSLHLLRCRPEGGPHHMRRYAGVNFLDTSS
jgi:hypothetical protein